MMNKKTIYLICSMLIVFSALIVFAEKKGESARIIFPERYKYWTHIKSMLILDKKHQLFNSFGGLHNIYANRKALESNKKGGKYPDGSRFAFVLYEAKESGGAYEAGKQKLTAVMVKNEKKFTATGGWGFQVFKAGSTEGSVKDAKKECFGCHSRQKNKDYVFSKYVE